MARPMLYNRLLAVGSITSVITLLTILIPHLLTIFNPVAHPLRFLTLLITLILNAKSLPLMWHFRLGRHTLNQYLFQAHPLSSASPGSALFKPIITKSLHSSLGECDYNLHKSNSTYFADADQARTMLMTSLLRKGLADGLAFPNGPAADVKGRYSISLGAVSCHFKREIAPYEGYDIWTRVLSWDRKWIYLVSHFVREGTVKPTGWMLQPWKKAGKARKGGADEEAWKKAVFATSMSKYVIKKGRLTIPPAECFQRSGLLPSVEQNGNGSNGSASGIATAWTMERIEARRLEGLKYAEKFAALDELNEQWPVLGGPQGGDVKSVGEQESLEVLGEFTDMW